MGDWIELYTSLLKELVENQKKLEQNERKSKNPVFAIQKNSIEKENENLNQQKQEIMTRIRSLNYDRRELSIINEVAMFYNQVEIDNILNGKKMTQTEKDTLVFQRKSIQKNISDFYKEKSKEAEEQLKKSALPLSIITNYMINIDKLARNGGNFTLKEIETIEEQI